jgi:hypothetical protein
METLGNQKLDLKGNFMRRILFLILTLWIAVPNLILADENISFYGPCWADSSGKDGKGGVSIVCSGDKHNFILRQDPCKNKIDLTTLDNHQDWLVYDSENSGHCLSFEFTWVTSPKDKFYGKLWAGGGLAFNNAWSALDFSKAKYLIFYARTNTPGVDFNIALSGPKEPSRTGQVKLSDYAEGHSIGNAWTRVVIPIASFPSLSNLNLTQVNTINFNLAGSYPENKSVYVHLDKVYFTDAQLVTPVENLGWLKVQGGVDVAWDKSNDDGITKYLATVDGKVVGHADGAEQRHIKLSASVLPAIGSHILGVASANGQQISSYQSVTISMVPQAVETAVVSVSPKDSHPISPYLYGFNFMSAENFKEEGGTVNRWGGNTASTYNWKDDADNKGNDWYFLNDPGSPPGTPESKKKYYQIVNAGISSGGTAIVTIPLTGWVAKAQASGQRSSYPLSRWPDQIANDGQGAGNGTLTNDMGFIWDNDPNLNYIPSTPAYQKEWVKTIVKNFGLSSKGGVKFYQMDNEPGIWCATHRDIRPKGVGYDELADLNTKYAVMVKSVDPQAKVIGLVAWGVKELAGSALDYMPGGVEGYKLGESAIKDNGWTDRKAHGDVPQFAWFLKEMNRRSKLAGKRLLDYVDDHGFPEVWGKDQNGRSVKLLTDDLPYDPVTAQKQFDAMRIFWDPTYESKDSWCDLPHLKSHLWDPWAGLIPKLKKMIEENYPGTKLAMTEYYPTSSSYYHGGLLEVVNLGIFMREGLDLACDWGTQDKNYVFLGHQLFSNYDGQGSKIGGNYVDAACTSPDLYSFAAREGAKTFVVLVNKNPNSELDTVLDLPADIKTYRTYTLAETLGKRLYDSGDQDANSAEIKLAVPAFSAILVVAE